jgi:serine/threonine-protein kinase TTK/MPS1
VYRVLAPNKKIYALKRINLSRRSKQNINDIINEITLMEALSGNMRIIQLYDYEINQEKGYIHMLMECGETDMLHFLEDQKNEPFDMNLIRMYWLQMLAAVHTIHEMNIVHTDLKPANFLLVSGRLKLIDFGIAKEIPDNTTNIRREDYIGTLNYMSPESFLNRGENGEKVMKMGRATDVWSLGCILYQMIYGNPPFAKLDFYVKAAAITNPNHDISYPRCVLSVPNTQVTVDENAIDAVKCCLRRLPKDRVTIPELMKHVFFNHQPLSTDSVLQQATSLQVAQTDAGRELIQHVFHQTLQYAQKRIKVKGPGPPDQTEVEWFTKAIHKQLTKKTRE